MWTLVSAMSGRSTSNSTWLSVNGLLNGSSRSRRNSWRLFVASDGWIVVPNWDKFQHYSDTQPVWIKLYTDLAHRDEWCHLTLAERGLLCSLWLEFALSNGQLRVDDVTKKVMALSRRRHLDSLQAAGFIEIVSRRPPELRARAKRREEKEKDSPKGSQAKTVDNSEAQRRKAKAWIDNVLPHLEGVDLAYTIADEFHIDDQDIVADLIAYAQERMLADAATGLGRYELTPDTTTPSSTKPTQNANDSKEEGPDMELEVLEPHRRNRAVHRQPRRPHATNGGNRRDHRRTRPGPPHRHHQRPPTRPGRRLDNARRPARRPPVPRLVAADHDAGRRRRRLGSPSRSPHPLRRRRRLSRSHVHPRRENLGRPRRLRPPLNGPNQGHLKAMRQPLGFIITLAGFDATPAEEMPVSRNVQSPGRQPAGSRSPNPNRKRSTCSATNSSKPACSPNRPTTNPCPSCTEPSVSTSSTGNKHGNSSTGSKP